MKVDMSLSNLGTVALHAAKVPTNVFSSPLICILTLDYVYFYMLITLKHKSQNKSINCEKPVLW